MQKIRLQSAMEYLMSYGWAILIIAVVIAVMFELGLFNGPPIANACIGSVGFSCQDAIFTNGGYLHFQLGQATGHTIYINGIACSQNTSADGYPMYGNIGVSPPGNINGYATINGNNTFKIYESGFSSYHGFESSEIVLSSGGYANVSVPCYNGANSIAQLQIGQVFRGTIWLNYSTTPSQYANYQITPITAKLIQRSDENQSLIFTTNNTYKTVLYSTTQPGHVMYICVGSSGDGAIEYVGNGNIRSWGYSSLTLYSFIATQTSNNCEIITTNPDLAIADIGVNSNQYTLYQTGTPYGSLVGTLDLQYTVTNPNSYVVIVASSGWFGIISKSIPSGCVTSFNNYGNDTYETVYAATCANAQPGAYNVIINTGSFYPPNVNGVMPNDGGIAISAFVFNSLS